LFSPQKIFSSVLLKNNPLSLPWTVNNTLSDLFLKFHPCPSLKTPLTILSTSPPPVYSLFFSRPQNVNRRAPRLAIFFFLVLACCIPSPWDFKPFFNHKRGTPPPPFPPPNRRPWFFSSWENAHLFERAFSSYPGFFFPVKGIAATPTGSIKRMPSLNTRTSGATPIPVLGPFDLIRSQNIRGSLRNLVRLPFRFPPPYG